MAKNQPKIYRQKNPRRIILRVLLCLLIIVFVFAFIALLGFRKYIAYSETGKLYLDIPWLYGYMDGKPETDDLAQYLTPVTGEEPEPETPEDAGSSMASDDDAESPEEPESGTTGTPADDESTTDQVSG